MTVTKGRTALPERRPEAPPHHNKIVPQLILKRVIPLFQLGMTERVACPSWPGKNESVSNGSRAPWTSGSEGLLRQSKENPESQARILPQNWVVLYSNDFSLILVNWAQWIKVELIQWSFLERLLCAMLCKPCRKTNNQTCTPGPLPVNLGIVWSDRQGGMARSPL